jgi:hypothetical protein
MRSLCVEKHYLQASAGWRDQTWGKGSWEMNEERNLPTEKRHKMTPQHLHTHALCGRQVPMVRNDQRRPTTIILLGVWFTLYFFFLVFFLGIENGKGLFEDLNDTLPVVTLDSWCQGKHRESTLCVLSHPSTVLVWAKGTLYRGQELTQCNTLGRLTGSLLGCPMADGQDSYTVQPEDKWSLTYLL